MFDDYLMEITRLLRSKTKELNVVVMPDFFLDRLLSLNCDVKTLFKNFEKVARKKGGSLDGIEQAEVRGGNAVNTAAALASLGVRVIPIVCTSKLGLELVRFYLKPLAVSLSHIKILDELSITTAMEFKTEEGRVNVMLRDVGALADFGPHDLDDEDFEAIENADYVCMFNWAGTRRFGTELARSVFRRVKVRGRGKSYYDTADPNPNEKKIPELVEKVLQSKYVDVLSVNENEAICFASQLSDEVEQLEKSLRLDEAAMESARILASSLSARVDLHTTTFSATVTRRGEIVVPAFKVPVLRVTGAGDSWNAGNILGDAHRLSDGSRLALANAVAAYYISSAREMHPNRRQLLEFCEKLKRDKTYYQPGS